MKMNDAQLRRRRLARLTSLQKDAKQQRDDKKDEAEDDVIFVLDVHWTVGEIGEAYRRSAVMTCSEEEARLLCTKRVRATTKRPIVVCFEDKRLVEWLRYSGFKTAMVSRPPRT